LFFLKRCCRCYVFVFFKNAAKKESHVLHMFIIILDVIRLHGRGSTTKEIEGFRSVCVYMSERLSDFFSSSSSAGSHYMVIMHGNEKIKI